VSELFSFASESDPVWSRLAAEIHTIVWDRIGVEKVRDIVRQWASEWNRRRDRAIKQAEEEWQRTGKGLPGTPHCRRHNMGLCRGPDHLGPFQPWLPGDCPSLWLVPSAPDFPPDPELPLPLSHRKRTPAEQLVALAAIDDTYSIDGDKINPWPKPIDERDLPAWTKWMKEGGAYWDVVEKAKELSEADKPVIDRWFKELLAKPKQGEGNGGAAPTPPIINKPDSSKPNDEKPRTRKSRKKRSDPKEDKRVADAYVTGGYRTEAACATALGMTEDEVHKSKDRHRKRQAAKERGRNKPRQ
jgi:hypothetical protein